jgi:glycosyltransferase involved in cell wall biosynthesis
VGRLVPEKGIADLLAAVALLPETMRLLIVGSGSHADALHAHATQLGIAARITWHAPVPTHAMPGIMQQCDALVLPSRTTANWKEQFGRVLVEAMACGVPVVGSSSGEIPHVVGDGGLIYAEGDTHALAAQLTVLLQDAPRYAAISAQARQRVLTHYTQQALAQRYAAIYRELNASRFSMRPSPTPPDA